MVMEPEFIVDTNGNRTKVILSYNNYLELLDLIEDSNDSKLIQETQEDTIISFSDFKLKRNIV